MELPLTLPALQAAAQQIFADPACGHILRIKGFLREDDGWKELNATRDTLHVEAIPDGQEVVIVIGEGVNRDVVERYLAAGGLR